MKFNQLSFVRVCDKMPSYMRHFDKGFDAIVFGTPAQLWGHLGHKDDKSYSVYKIENGKVVDHIAWYEENQLTLLPNQDKDKAKEMIKIYENSFSPSSESKEFSKSTEIHRYMVKTQENWLKRILE